MDGGGSQHQEYVSCSVAEEGTRTRAALQHGRVRCPSAQHAKPLQLRCAAQPFVESHKRLTRASLGPRQGGRQLERVGSAQRVHAKQADGTVAETAPYGPRGAPPGVGGAAPAAAAFCYLHSMDRIDTTADIVPPEAAAALIPHLRDRRIVVLAGAGMSTESGIPDYRGAGAPSRRAPVQYQEFVRSPAARGRYWSRSTIGWPRMRGAQPNDAHRALARMEQAGHVAGLITQNVDGLHQAAGSRRIVELHGSLSIVRCIACGTPVPRDVFQQRLLESNADWPPLRDPGMVHIRPDGDAELPDAELEDFRVPACHVCGGIMKPDVVFFGENVAAPVVGRAWSVFEEGDVLLVAGSSLTVYSGRRFIDRATRDGMPIVVINRGPTRADEVAMAKVDGALGVVLPALADALDGA